MIEESKSAIRFESLTQVNTNDFGRMTAPIRSQNIEIIKEGVIKRDINFFQSSRHRYRLVSSGMLLRSEGDKKPFLEKYDMKKYYVTLHSKDKVKFFLVPLPQFELSQGLSSIKFIAGSVEDRAIWVDALNSVAADSE
jgi:hypothetical protein